MTTKGLLSVFISEIPEHLKPWLIVIGVNHLLVEDGRPAYRIHFPAIGRDSDYLFPSPLCTDLFMLSLHIKRNVLRLSCTIVYEGNYKSWRAPVLKSGHPDFVNAQAWRDFSPFNIESLLCVSGLLKHKIPVPPIDKSLGYYGEKYKQAQCVLGHEAISSPNIGYSATQVDKPPQTTPSNGGQDASGNGHSPRARAINFRWLWIWLALERVFIIIGIICLYHVLYLDFVRRCIHKRTR